LGLGYKMQISAPCLSVRVAQGLVSNFIATSESHTSDIKDNRVDW
jgi:hypothetical protein